MKDKQISLKNLPQELNQITTKQKIYLYVKEHPSCLQSDVAKAVNLGEVKDQLNDLERNGILGSKTCPCGNAKLWSCKK